MEPADPSLNPLFQVGLDVRHRRCLVIGGGGEAADKSGRLLDAGADLVVVSPDATPALQAWHDAGRLELRRRRYEPGDLDGAFMVMNTVRSDAELTQAVFAAGSRRGILVNSYDDPPHSHFGMAALVAAGPLRVSISTSNASPSLARRLREDLSEMFGPEFCEYLEALAVARTHVKDTVPAFTDRRRILRGLVEGFGVDGAVRLPPDWRRRVGELVKAPPAGRRSAS